jgi:hypothetical protein
MPRLEKMLSVFNPDIPVYLGKPFATKHKGVAGPDPLWQDFTTMSFCHGGSGYILSRALLKIVGPLIQDAPQTTSLEDAAVASVLYQYSGVRCINVNSRMFGGLDLFGNSHDQAMILSRVKQYEANEPHVLQKTTTIHSVQAEVTRYLHPMYQRINSNATLDSLVDIMAERDLEIRRIYLTTSWNCSLPEPVDPSISYRAMCQQSALLSPPPALPKHLGAFDAVWYPLPQATMPAPSPCQVLDPAQAHDTVVSWMRAPTADPRVVPPPLLATAGGAAQPPPMDRKEHLVMVVADGNEEDVLAPLQLLVRSLRSTGCTARVVVFASAPMPLATLAAEFCNVEVVGFDPVAVAKAYAETSSYKTTEAMINFILFESYLHQHGSRHERAFFVPVDTFFQRDPFLAFPARDGVVLLVDDPVVTVEQLECFAGLLRIHEMPAMISLDVAMGTVEALRSFLAESLDVSYRIRRCAFSHTVVLNVFRKIYAVNHPVTVLMPWDAPVSMVTERQDLPFRRVSDGLLAQNLRAVPTAAVINYLSRLEPSKDQLVLPPPEAVRTQLQLVAEAAGTRLEEVVFQLNNFSNPSPREFPPDSKAFLRWSALGSMPPARFSASTRVMGMSLMACRPGALTSPSM